MAKAKKRYVVIATQTRPWSIVAGELVSHRPAERSATLANARMIVWYSADAHSLLGVAAHGPGKTSRVSPSVEHIDVEGYELLADASAEARAAIEAEPWH
jgi:hypothetical protein